MKRALFVTIAALGLAACAPRDIEPSALAPASNSQAPAQDQRPASPYSAGQAPDNTGDYSHYF